MRFTLEKKIGVFWLINLLVLGFLRTSLASIPASHGGTLVEYQGTDYEIVNEEATHQIRVYTPAVVGPSRTKLMLTLKRKNFPTEHIHLQLTSVTPESLVYTGIVPARVLISGGIRFEIAPFKR